MNHDADTPTPPPQPGHEAQATLARIREAHTLYPALAERIDRALLIALHSRGIATIDDIHDRARALAGSEDPGRARPSGDDNAPQETRLDEMGRGFIALVTHELAAATLTPEDVDDVVNLTRKREEARALEEIANLSQVSFRVLAERVHAFCSLPMGQTLLPESEAMAVRVALTRHFISDQLEFIGVARQALTIRDFDELLQRVIGDDNGMGRIGGKAAGLLLARCILRRARAEDPRAPQVEIASPESWYLRSDVIERFLEHQGLYELQSHKYREIEEIRKHYPLIVKMFKNAELPPVIVGKLRAMLEEVGEHPLVVRSSSLLEDRFGAAFAGKYRSIFVANQGPLEARLAELIGAITEVYASTLHPDPISYRRRHNLLDYAENMAVLIQKVVGQRYGKWFLPTWAGVAFSRNEFRRNPRVKAEDGIARIVLGLGTRAVDRVSTDFPRMIPLGVPTLRAEVRDVDVVRASQREVDAIDLERNVFTTVPLSELLCDEWLPGLEQVVSIYRNGILRRPVGKFLDADANELVVTFDNFVQDSQYPALLRWVLQTLERAYGQPVDIEFACDGERFHILQCRPQVVRGSDVPVRLPQGVGDARKVFTANRDVTNGSVAAIEYVVLVDAAAYDRLEPLERKVEVARVVHAVNERLKDRVFILMGPGRWGSKDPRLGVKTGYADLCNARMLIEVARPLGGFIPEASFGSHFFQDLVESDIYYLALYPEDEGVLWNGAFLEGSPNDLHRICPEFAGFEDVVRVIHVPVASGGLYLRVDMDGEAGEALGYLTSV